jgi:von Willebrand factor type A domain
VVLSSVLILSCTLGFQEQSRATAPEEPPAQGKVQAPARTPQKSAAPSTKDQKSVAPKTPESAGKPSTAKKSDKKPQAPAATAPPANAPGSIPDVRVRTQAEMRKRSEFLMPPGSSPEDRYNPDAIIDWRDVPPWRQASFFGIRARGQFFVYVVDCSGSMIDDDRFPRATIELRRSVMALREPQKFEVIFYNTESIPMPGGPIARTADFHAKQQLLTWLRVIEPDSGTDPRMAMKQALSLRPDAVFLLSDGAFPDGTVQEIGRINTRKVPIHCVDLAGGLGGDHLKRIAEANGGTYASRPGDLQGRP